MSNQKIWINFDCPHCGKLQNKGVFKGAEVEVIYDQCKNSIGIVIDNNGNPTRIGQLTSISKLLKSTKGGTDTTQGSQNDMSNTPSINIGSVYGHISISNDTNITNIYNNTVKIINDAKNIGEEQKSQAKNILDFVKNTAAPFLPVVAEAIKKALGL